MLAGKQGINYMIEIKDGSKPPSKRRLTPDEEDFHAGWRGRIEVIESVDDVIEFDREVTGSRAASRCSCGIPPASA